MSEDTPIIEDAPVPVAERARFSMLIKTSPLMMKITRRSSNGNGH